MNRKQAEQASLRAILDKTKQIGMMAGYELVLDEEAGMLVAPFDMGNGRKQVVYIRSAGQSPTGQNIISFSSPCLEIKKGFMKGLKGNQAIDILRRNSSMPFGQFGLYDFGDREVLMSASCQILETMEVEEFEAHIQCVASVADSYEVDTGKDEF